MPRSSESSSEEAYKLLPIFDKDEGSGNARIDEREGPYLLSGIQSAIMIFKFCVGAGVFSLPLAFRYSGLLVGVVWIFVCGALTTYGMKRLVESSWEVARRTGTRTAYFGDIGAACARQLNEQWEFVGRLTIDIILSIATFCLLCPMELFIAAIWKQGFEDHNLVNLGISAWILIVFILLLPSVFVRRADLLALLSLISNIFEALVILSVFVNIFSTASSWKVNNSVEWSNIPLTIGITFFAFEIAPFILSVENVTKKPKQFIKVTSVVMAIVSCVYAIMGSFGYVYCYPECADSLILNLPSSWYYSVVKILIGLSGSCSAILIMHVEYNVVEPILKEHVSEDRYYLVALIHRIFVLTFSCAVTASVPQLGNVISLAGVFVTATVGFILPVISHTLLLYHKLSRFTITANMVFLFCGIAILFSGVYTSVSKIIVDY